MEFARRDGGQIEVVCGPMFSGKTEELIRRLRRAVIARQRVQVFKPAIDRRYHETRITSHSAQSLDAHAVADVDALLAALRRDTHVVGIDEAQFFGTALVPTVQRLADGGARVLIAGLDQDYLGRPFEPIPQLLAIAEHITKCSAICAQCGAPASRSFRLRGGGERIQVGAAESYEARCRACHVRGMHDESLELGAA
jgi:thymidine kinase